MLRFKRLLPILLAIALIVSLAACTGATTTTTKATTTAAGTQTGTTAATTAATTTVGKPVKITVELLDFGNIPEGQGTWADNRWTKYAKEEALKIGVEVEFVIVPRTEEVPKLNALMSSNSAPDLVHTYDRTVFLNYVSMGGITELDKYMATSGADIQKWFGDDQLQYGKVGGKLYAIPARRSSYCLEGSFIRQDWLDKLGLKMPTTADELYTTLKTFKDNAAKLGTTTVVPIGVGNDANSYLSEILLSFCKTPTEEQLATIPMFMMDGYVDGLKFANKLYTEGFMNKDFALDANAVKLKENYANNQIAYVKNHSAYPWMDLNHVGLQTKVTDARIVAFGGLKNKSGEFYFKQGVAVGFYNFIPKTAKNPEACVKYLNWMIGVGYDKLWWGIEGEHYTVVNGVKVAKDTAYNDKTLNWMRAWICPVFNMTADKDTKVQKQLLETRFGGQNGKDYRDGILMWETHAKPGILLDSIIASASKYSSALNTLTIDSINKIVSGTAANVETAYANLVKEYLAAGGQAIIDESKAAYAKMKK